MSGLDSMTSGIRPWEIDGPSTVEVDLTWAVQAALGPSVTRAAESAGADR